MEDYPSLGRRSLHSRGNIPVGVRETVLDGNVRYCALICEPSELRANGANGECGTGSCQSVAGVGLCTYAQQKPTNSAVLSLAKSPQALVV